MIEGRGNGGGGGGVKASRLGPATLHRGLGEARPDVFCVSLRLGLMFPSHQEHTSPDILLQISMCILLVATIDCQGRRSKVVMVVVVADDASGT